MNHSHHQRQHLNYKRDSLKATLLKRKQCTSPDRRSWAFNLEKFFLFREPAGELRVIVLSLKGEQHGPVYEGNRTENRTHDAFWPTTPAQTSTQQAPALPNR
jgi:hypothetical protein